MSLTSYSPSITFGEPGCEGHEKAVGFGVPLAEMNETECVGVLPSDGPCPPKVEDYIAACVELFGLENVAERLDKGGSPYTYYSANHGGGVVEENESQEGMEEIETEIMKVLGCNKTGLRFLGVQSGLTYYKFIQCMRWYCEHCGKHNGKIHNRRMSRLLENMGSGVLAEIVIRQFVFTIPPEWRKYFESRGALNAFVRLAENVIKKLYPGKYSVLYLHCFGDRAAKGDYNPHVNIHVKEDDMTARFALSLESLREIKKMLWQGLISYIRTQDSGFRATWKESEERMNIHYSFVKGEKKIKHKLRYMSRLHPNFEDYKYLKGNRAMLRLFVVEMKGFNYIRYFNGSAEKQVSDVDRRDEVREMEGVCGERLKFVVGGNIKRSEFNMLYRSWDYEELTEGFYRISEKQKEARK